MVGTQPFHIQFPTPSVYCRSSKKSTLCNAIFLSYVVILMKVHRDDNTKWHHVAISYDGNMLTIYVDNVKTNLGALKGTLLDRFRLFW